MITMRSEMALLYLCKEVSVLSYTFEASVSWFLELELPQLRQNECFLFLDVGWYFFAHVVSAFIAIDVSNDLWF